VDALCIVQDDESDWKEEAPKMGSIYENAYLTLAASAAKSTEQGLFAPLQHDKIVELPCNPHDPSEGSMYFAPEYIPFEEVANGSLNKRAWVLQERLLSRRIIHIAATRTYWECRQIYESEDRYPRNYVQDASDRGKRLASAVEKFVQQLRVGANAPVPAVEEYIDRSYEVSYELHEVWRDIVCQYSQCGLTFHTDKLPAILGIATRIHEVTKITYSAGHWFDGTIDAAALLLWCPAGKQMTRPEAKRAPSWSWAALDGAVHFLPSDLDISRLQEHDNDLKVLPFSSDERMVEGLPIQVLGSIKSVNRCGTAHQVVSGKLDHGPGPHAKFYHLGDTCYPDPDWHSLADNATDTDPFYSFQFVAEMHAQLYPNAEPLQYPSGVDYTYPTEEMHQPLPIPPGIGWVTFDCEDEEPEEFDLLYVCTRAFRGTRKRTASQYLALAIVSTNELADGPAYKRVGVAQVHEIDWFLDAEEQVLTLV